MFDWRRAPLPLLIPPPTSSSIILPPPPPTSSPYFTFPAIIFIMSLSKLKVGRHICLEIRQPPKLSSTSKLIMNFYIKI